MLRGLRRRTQYESQVVSKNDTSRIPTTRSPEVLANHADELSCNNNAEEDDLLPLSRKLYVLILDYRGCQYTQANHRPVFIPPGRSFSVRNSASTI